MVLVLFIGGFVRRMLMFVGHEKVIFGAPTVTRRIINVKRLVRARADVPPHLVVTDTMMICRFFTAVLTIVETELLMVDVLVTL